jgi:hypothetical protein
MLGSSVHAEPLDSLQLPPGLDDDIDFGGLSLEEYAKNVSSLQKQAGSRSQQAQCKRIQRREVC